jgi:hypothetical protein
VSAVTEPVPRVLDFPALTTAEKAESFAWVLILGHVVHWAVDAAYFTVTQVRYGFQGFSLWAQSPGGVRRYAGWRGHSNPFTLWYLKDAWDRLPVHLSNVLHAGWFASVAPAPQWWVTWRHDTRYVVIGVVTGVVIFFLLSKPRRDRESYTWHHMALTPLRALLYAVPGVAIGGLLVWKVRWLHAAGITAPASWGMAGHEVNQWSASGKLSLLAMGLLGSWLFARWASLGPADEAQWVYAEQAAARILRRRSRGALGSLSGRVIIGPPGLRTRIRWLVGTAGKPSAWHGADGTARYLRAKAAGNSGLGMRIIVRAFLVLTVAAAGYGAWLTIAGPAAGA